MSEDFEVKICAPGKLSHAIKFGAKESLLAREWSNMAYNRRRWQQAETLLTEIYQQASDNWKFSADKFSAMAATGLIEVSIPWGETADAEAARQAPWEFIITSTVRDANPQAKVPTVVRHLDTGKRKRPIARNRSHLFVKSAPGPFEALYEFDSERKLVQESLKPAEVKTTDNPTLAELREEVLASKPSIIHVAGVDNIQGASILGTGRAASPGIYLKQGGEFEATPAKDIAAALTADKGKRPFLVSYNLYHSSAHLAAGTVAAGAWASLGFQDEFDDTLAEIFFTNLYMGLQSSGQDLLTAFRLAFYAITSHPRAKQSMQGTSIVLWTAESLTGDSGTQYEPVAALQAQTETEKKVRERKEALIEADPRTVLSYDVKPLSALNYCLLHNGASMFDKFTLRKAEVGALPGVSIEVQLQVQGDKFCYEELRDIIECSEPVRPCISLTAGMVRALRERIQTSILVCVRCRGQELYRRTYSVGLLATDEWENTDLNRKWLPSFVLPRDPAVDRVIRAAQPFLVTLADNRAAGFDGYQARKPEAVDNQVKAIWWALVYQLAINYISPPPTFTSQSQRLRSPTAVLEGSSGTCIDLALLLAACLEYIQLRPVVFLQRGHAYTGYLRSEKDYREFRTLFQSRSDASEPEDGGRSGKLQTPWMLEKDQYRAIAQLIDEDKLRPLDTVKLTQREGFELAKEEGINRFSAEEEFQAVYDVREARLREVTPLPL